MSTPASGRTAALAFGGIASLILLSIVIAKVWLTPGEDKPADRVPRNMKAARAPETAPAPRDPAGLVELLDLVQAGEDAVLGGWGFEDRSLVSPSLAWARLQFPCRPPEEYDLKLIVSRRSGTNSLNIGLPFGAVQVVAVLDGWTGGDVCGLDIVGGKPFYENVTTRRQRLLKRGSSVPIVCSVRSGGITVTVGEVQAIDWKGSADQLSLLPNWEVRDAEALFIGCYDSAFAIQQAVLIPVTGTAQLRRGVPKEPGR